MTRQAKIFGFALALILSISGAAIARERGAMSSKQYGYNTGYQDGYQVGRQNRDYGSSYNYHSEDYRLADRGYQRWMGEHDDFQGGYRKGYRAGYDDGYQGRANHVGYPYQPSGSYGPYGQDNGGYYGPSSGYGNRGYGDQNAASDFGYRDGFAMGQKDWRKGKDYRPTRNDNYEDANHGYHKEFGDKNYYKDQYRRAFLRGYREGYGGSDENGYGPR